MVSASAYSRLLICGTSVLGNTDAGAVGKKSSRRGWSADGDATEGGNDAIYMIKEQAQAQGVQSTISIS